MNRLGIGLACLVGVGLSFATGAPAHAATYDGTNAYTHYRLPWQHGESHGLTQGYNQGNHTGDFEQYSLDFQMPTGTPVLAITDGWACTTDGSGLGTYVVQIAPPPPGSGRGGTDYYFLGHNDSSWITLCKDGWTYLYEGFKAGAKAGTTVYQQDLNGNGVADGVEYDRTVVGPAHSGPPDGAVSAQDAQLAFAQYRLNYRC